MNVLLFLKFNEVAFSVIPEIATFLSYLQRKLHDFTVFQDNFSISRSNLFEHISSFNIGQENFHKPRRGGEWRGSRVSTKEQKEPSFDEALNHLSLISNFREKTVYTFMDCTHKCKTVHIYLMSAKLFRFSKSQQQQLITYNSLSSRVSSRVYWMSHE